MADSAASSAQAPDSFRLKEKVLAYAVHCYTASGLVFSMLALMAIVDRRYHMVYFWNSIAVIIDSSDGYFARKFRVKEVLPHMNGRKLDDIIDFINYTFIPLFLVWRMGLLPEPALLWVMFPMMTSMFAFIFEGVKEEKAGFFVGFPSYWNFFALYADLGFSKVGPWFTLGVMLVFGALTVAPLRYVYPTLAQRWRKFFVWGAIVWTGVFLYMLTFYKSGIPAWLVWGSFTYPVLYLVLSTYLDFSSRREEAAERAAAAAQ